MVAAATLALVGVATLDGTSTEIETVAGPKPIVGGTNVSSAPWAAAVYLGSSFNCSGAVIADKWVLTAKHCLGSSINVRVGNAKKSLGKQITVTRSVTPPSGADLALLELSGSAGTSSVGLTDTDPPVGSTNDIYGWGRTSCEGTGPDQMKTASVRVDTVNGQDAYGGSAISSTGVNGYAWKGDSGGPQMYQGKIVGVASTADCGNHQNYGSVAKSRAWIRSTAGV
ncbi:peptidase S1 [Pseudonocardiaceae bacterium YIM PH 21723]|nr:peptidase S1 [Pseudonocardiaceae bacterium YIM PH 21723]